MIRVQTVCKSYQQKTLDDKELNTLYYGRLLAYTVKPENWNLDFSKYSLIRNKFWT